MVVVVVEHDGGRLKPVSLAAISAAQQLAERFAVLVIGHNVQDVAQMAARLGPSVVLVADNAELEQPLGDRFASVIAQVTSNGNFDTVVAGSSTFSKDVLPRVAALIDAPMVSDITDIIGQGPDRQFVRPVHAGSTLATVQVAGERLVVTCRSANFEAPPENDATSPIETVDFDWSTLPHGTTYVSRESSESERPELTEARVVVSGGRPLKDRPTFDSLIGGLADSLGGAVGATRAAVDADMAPNDWQIGQTGKVITPDVYIAAGVSGSIQHSAGIQDSRVIVAINKDPEAPIFELATYGLVGDLFDVLPELIDAFQQT